MSSYYLLLLPLHAFYTLPSNSVLHYFSCSCISFSLLSHSSFPLIYFFSSFISLFSLHLVPLIFSPPHFHIIQLKHLTLIFCYPCMMYQEYVSPFSKLKMLCELLSPLWERMRVLQEYWYFSVSLAY